MYELVQVAENTYYINSPSKIGVYRVSDDDVWLIDSGNDKDAGRKIQKILDAQGWKLTAIINPDETIAIASNLTENTRVSEVKYDALRFLAYAYKAKGDIDSAKAALEQIPELYFTKLTEIAYLLEGKEKFEAAEKQKWISFENLLQMMQKLAECYEADGDIAKAIVETETALQLLPILKNKAFDIYVEFFEKELERLKGKLQ